MHKNGFILAVLLVICLALSGCSKDDNTTTYSEFTKTDAGEPYSDWLKAPTGSAKYLDGDSILVSIFVYDSSSNWLDSDIRIVEDNISIACNYLKSQGKQYGKDVNLIYDTSINPNLEYHMSYDDTQYKHLSDEEQKDKLVDAIYEYIGSDIDTKALMEQYQVNSIGYMVFVDGEADSCTAYPYYTYYNEWYYEEFCIINLRWTSGINVEPRTYAHEILHLFGARDLYHTSNITGIYKDFVLYANDKYSDDIMLGSYSEDANYSRKIESDITKLTAYFIGWNKYIAELETYPSIEAEYTASFCDTKHKKDNYEYYSLEEKYEDNDKVYNILIIILIVSLVIRTIIIIYRNIKFDKESANAIHNDMEYNSNLKSLKEMNQIYISMEQDDDSDIIRDEEKPYDMS